MTVLFLIQSVATALCLMLLTALFLLYRNPLFEIYLANWGLC